MFTVVVRRRDSVDIDRGVQPDKLHPPLNPLGAADRVEMWRDDQCVIATATVENTPESIGAARVEVDESTGTVVVGWSRLDDRSGLIKALDGLAGVDASSSDTRLLLAAFRRWGEDCPLHLTGAFSFAVWQPSSGRLFAARDQLGFRPLYHYADERVTVLSTTAATMPALGCLRLEPSEEWMSAFVTNISMSHTDTAWSTVHKLAGGHRMTAHDDGRVTLSRYHEFVDDAPDATKVDPVWVERYRAILDVAVGDRLRTAFPLGIETSGGIDSSTCLAFAASQLDDPDKIHTFGFIGSELEPDFIYETSRAHGIVNDHIGPRRDFATWPTDRSLDIMGYPAEHGMGAGHLPFYVLAQQLGVRTLQSGFGGDEVVTNAAGLVYRELVAQRRFATLWRLQKGPIALRPLRVLRTLERTRPKVVNSSTMLAVARDQIDRFIVRDEVVERWSLRSKLLYRNRYSAGYQRLNTWILDERLGNPFVPSRLESCMLFANAFGIEYRWPLLDHRLVQQWLSTPSIEKFGPGIGRYLHRRAIDGVVPDVVAWKPNKDMGDPLGRGTPRAEITAAPAYHEAVEQLVDRRQLADVSASATTLQQRNAVRRQIANLGALDAFMQRHHP